MHRHKEKPALRQNMSWSGRSHPCFTCAPLKESVRNRISLLLKRKRGLTSANSLWLKRWIPYCVGGLRLNLKITGFYMVLDPRRQWLVATLAFQILHFPCNRRPLYTVPHRKGAGTLWLLDLVFQEADKEDRSRINSPWHFQLPFQNPVWLVGRFCVGDDKNAGRQADIPSPQTTDFISNVWRDRS